MHHLGAVGAVLSRDCTGTTVRGFEPSHDLVCGVYRYYFNHQGPRIYVPARRGFADFGGGCVHQPKLVFLYLCGAGRRGPSEQFGVLYFSAGGSCIRCVVFRGKVTAGSVFAVGLAVVAVLILSVGVGQVPYISLVLAFTFGFYGLVKKGLTIGPMRSVFWEVIALLPLALIWLMGAHWFDWQGVAGRSGGYFGSGLQVSVLLVLSGIVTGLPLVLMAYAMERLRLATVGLVQYLNPTLQFTLAVVVFMEPVGRTHIVAFALIWIGLGIYSFNALRQERT